MSTAAGPDMTANLIGVHLTGSYGRTFHLGVHLTGVHLTGVHLSGVHLTGVHLPCVHLLQSLKH